MALRSVRSRKVGECNSLDGCGLATWREQCAPDLTVAGNCLGVQRERVLQAGSEQTQGNRVRDKQNLLQTFVCAVFAKLLKKRLNALGNHSIGLAATLRNPIPAGIALAAIGWVGFDFQVG